jgi:hypothetical protein
MTYVHNGRVVEKRHLLDPRRLMEWIQQLFAGIAFFFITIGNPSAAQAWIDGKRKKDDPYAGACSSRLRYHRFKGSVTAGHCIQF